MVYHASSVFKAGRALVATCFLMMFACGDEPVSPEQQAQERCEVVYAKLCDRACACTAGDDCDITDGDGTVISSDNRDECDFLTQLFCPNENGRPTDIELCSTELDAAECQTQDDGDQALVQPVSCRNE